MKINFTQEHFSQLQQLAVHFLFNNLSVKTPTGQILGVSEILHTTTINSLTSIKQSVIKKIESKENADEWGSSDYEQKVLEELKVQREFINLVIGWKRKQAEIQETNQTRETLTKELSALKDSQKTPDDKIKEIEDKLKALESF